MDSRLNQKLANEHAAERRRRAEAERLVATLRTRHGRRKPTAAVRHWLGLGDPRARGPARAWELGDTRVRYARPGDERALAYLAALDSARVPPAPILVAELDGRLRAAVSVTDSTAIADPFHLTADLVAALRERAVVLRAAAADSAARQAPAWRPAPRAQQEESI